MLLPEKHTLSKPSDSRQPNQIQHPEYFNYISQVDVERKILGESVPMHWHEFCELEFVVSGNGQHRFKNQNLPYEAGVLFLQLPTDFHEVIIDDDDKPFVYNIKFSEAYIDSAIYQMLYTDSDNAIHQIQLSGNDYDMVLRDLEEMYAEYDGESIFREHIIKAILEKLIIKLERNVAQQADLKLSTTQARASQDIIVESLTYIQKNYASPISLATLAGHVNVSANYFSTLFRQNVGCTFRDYLINVRMRYAISLLTSVTLPVYIVGECTGFNSYTHFERTFRKKFGMSPKTFRETLKERHRDNSFRIRTVQPDNDQGLLHRRRNQLYDKTTD